MSKWNSYFYNVKTVEEIFYLLFTGEEWMVRKTGSYLPGVYEEIVKVVKSYVLTLNDGLYLTAEIALTDGSGKKR